MCHSIMTPIAQIGMIIVRADFEQDLPATLAFFAGS
jgi:hypothetical protein